MRGGCHSSSGNQLLAATYNTPMSDTWPLVSVHLLACESLDELTIPEEATHIDVRIPLWRFKHHRDGLARWISGPLATRVAPENAGSATS